MNDQIKTLIVETLSPRIDLLKTGLPSLGEYRETVTRIVDDCEKILSQITDHAQISTNDLGQQFSMISRQIETAITILNDQVKSTRNSICCAGNRKKLHRAYNIQGRG